MGIKVSKFTPIFVESISVVFNATNPGRILSKKTMAIRYHFTKGHVAKNIFGVRKIHIRNNFAYPFTKPPVINDFHGFSISAG